MKTFNNKETKISKGEEKGFLLYSDLLLLGLSGAPPEGWTIEDMKQSMTISSKIENLEKNIDVSLEDAEFKFAHSRIPKKWTIRHEDIISFVEAMNNLNKE
jgi:hypothetical protein